MTDRSLWRVLGALGACVGGCTAQAGEQPPLPQVTSTDQAAVSCSRSRGRVICTTITGSLLELTALRAGDPSCSHGGTQIDTGIDQDDDGELDVGEILQTEYACNGADGQDGADGVDGHSSLIAVTSVAAGNDHCKGGGSRIESGLDLDGNDTLDSGEVTSTAYVCNGADGADGFDGTDGASSLVSASTEPAGAQCGAGGLRIDTGLDLSGEGTLDPAEIEATSYVCNGAAGTAGEGGPNLLVSVSTEPAGAACAAGGVRLDSGQDNNPTNGQLDPVEISSTSYACTDPTAFNGASPMVIAVEDSAGGYDSLTSGVNANLVSASIVAPVPGKVLAIATTQIYCDSSGDSEYACADGGDYTVANFTVTRTGAGAGMGTSGTSTYAYLVDGGTTYLTTTEVTSVPAGTHEFNATALVGVDGSAGSGTASAAFSATELTLVFMPN